MNIRSNQARRNQTRRIQTKRKQKGVALFVTLLVVTIATLLATEIWFNNTLDISRQNNNRASYQAQHYAKGMVLWARDVLRQDYEQDNNFDNHSEPWNQTIAGIQLDDAILSGKLKDLDGKFNLNNLVIQGAVNQLSHEYFKRILINLELDIGLADKIIDWMDFDQLPRPQGAEDTSYLSRNPSYRSAGQQMYHISELKLIDGINQKTYERLKSFVTVLPVRGKFPTKVNINTASSLLLKSLDSDITSKDAIMLYNDGNASNKQLLDFYSQLQHRTIDRDELDQLIMTKSNWYQAEISVTMEQAVFKKHALIVRNSAPASVKQWSDTPY